LQAAIRRLPAIIAEIELRIEVSRHSSGLPVDAALMKPFLDNCPRLPEPSCGQSENSSISLGGAYERYLSDPTHAWSPSTRQAYETTRDLVIRTLGADLHLIRLGRRDVRELIDVLRYLPRNSAKLFPSLGLREAADRAKTNPSMTRISTANANAYIGNFSTFLNWAVSEELIARNPARGLRLPDEVAPRDKRHPFSSIQLRRIFDAPIYTGCADGERAWATSGDNLPRNARFWVPLVALHSGMRLNEICQLDVTDVRRFDGVSCFCLSEASLVGSTDKVLKTSASERLIPIHPFLITLGLEEHASHIHRQGQTKLFHDIEFGSRSKRSVAFSKWFTRFLRSCGAYKERTSFHSFRHNFRDALRIAKVDHEISMSLGGWVGGRSKASAASDNYGSGHPVASLHEAICRLEFGDLDLSHLVR
jgi:integrase